MPKSEEKRSLLAAHHQPDKWHYLMLLFGMFSIGLVVFGVFNALGAGDIASICMGGISALGTGFVLQHEKRKNNSIENTVTPLREGIDTGYSTLRELTDGKHLDGLKTVANEGLKNFATKTKGHQTVMLDRLNTVLKALQRPSKQIRRTAPLRIDHKSKPDIGLCNGLSRFELFRVLYGTAVAGLCGFLLVFNKKDSLSIDTPLTVTLASLSTLLTLSFMSYILLKNRFNKHVQAELGHQVEVLSSHYQMLDQAVQVTNEHIAIYDELLHEYQAAIHELMLQEEPKRKARELDMIVDSFLLVTLKPIIANVDADEKRRDVPELNDHYQADDGPLIVRGDLDVSEVPADEKRVHMLCNVDFWRKLYWCLMHGLMMLDTCNGIGTASGNKPSATPVIILNCFLAPLHAFIRYLDFRHFAGSDNDRAAITGQLAELSKQISGFKHAMDKTPVVAPVSDEKLQHKIDNFVSELVNGSNPQNGGKRGRGSSRRLSLEAHRAAKSQTPQM